MANYEARGRSNYFGVLDEESFRELCRRYELEVIEKTENGGRLLGFLVLGEGGLPTSYQDESTGQEIEGDPLAEMVELLTPGHVAVYTEVGYERMKYLGGYAVAVNADGERAQVTLDEIMARAQPLGQFVTRCQF